MESLALGTARVGFISQPSCFVPSVESTRAAILKYAARAGVLVAKAIATATPFLAAAAVGTVVLLA